MARLQEMVTEYKLKIVQCDYWMHHLIEELVLAVKNRESKSRICMCLIDLLRQEQKRDLFARFVADLTRHI